MWLANVGQTLDAAHPGYVGEGVQMELESQVVMPSVSTENQTLVLYKTANALSC